MEIVMSRGEGDSLVIFTQEKELKPGLQQPGVESDRNKTWGLFQFLIIFVTSTSASTYNQSHLICDDGDIE
jgi:hypothetical protein